MGKSLTNKLFNPRRPNLPEPCLRISHEQIHKNLLKRPPQRPRIHLGAEQPEELGHVLGLLELPLPPAHGLGECQGRNGEGRGLEVGEEVVKGGAEGFGGADAWVVEDGLGGLVS